MCASLLHHICASLFPGDLKGITPWLLRVSLSGPLNTGCMVSAHPGGGGVGSPCSTSPRVGGMTASQEKPGYLGMVSSWSCSPTDQRVCFTLSPDMKLRCNMSPHPLSQPAEWWHGPSSLEGHLHAQALPLSSWAYPQLGCLGVIYKNKEIPSASGPKQSPLFNHFC